MESTQAQPPAKAKRVAPDPALRFDEGPLAGTTIRLDQPDGTIGRRGDNAYVVDNPAVSRVHARLSREGERALVLTDLGSSGGTTVNGERISGPQVLAHGDTVGFADVVCTFVDPMAMADREEATVVFDVTPVSTGPELSPRQSEVLELIAEGHTNAQIGEKLGISERTVKAYAQEVYDKLGVNNRAGAVGEAMRSGLL